MKLFLQHMLSGPQQTVALTLILKHSINPLTTAARHDCPYGSITQIDPPSIKLWNGL